MGNYLDSPDALTAYTAVYNSPYFIDKSAILNEIIPRMKIYRRFLRNHKAPNITRKGLRAWYDGYSAKSGERVYNPRSVVAALTNNNLGNYWTSSGPYDEIYYYINHNTDALRDDLSRMVSGASVPAKVREYAATSMNLTPKDEIFSAMTVYGFLSFEKGCVRIPNHELMERFDDMLRKEPSLGYVHQLAQASEKMHSDKISKKDAGK